MVVDNLSFTARPGRVTGFLGPNGAGKSTTMRLILGLDHPTSGTVTVNGRPYVEHPTPLKQLGALLEARAVHTSRSAYNHLRALAATHAIPDWRVSEVIDQVGLSEVAHKRAGAFSLGMGQRLGIASALLADPAVIMLDEPVNGLDPEGVRWVRSLLRDLAKEGRTVLLSSHLMSEMELTADHLIIVGRGRLLADMSMEEMHRAAATDDVLVRTADAERLRQAVAGPGVTVTSSERQVLEIAGLTSHQIGKTAASLGLVLDELTPRRETLEEVFLRLTADATDFHAGAQNTNAQHARARRIGVRLPAHRKAKK
ncbi:multidrug ABC transporter ATP-binding protein [Pseudofrankia sp. EUN1h]|nr:multidrug ABC transporter ATP-binding protein [Pseudofrankia sp. EUN1h]